MIVYRHVLLVLSLFVLLIFLPTFCSLVILVFGLITDEEKQWKLVINHCEVGNKSLCNFLNSMKKKVLQFLNLAYESASQPLSLAQPFSHTGKRKSVA